VRLTSTSNWQGSIWPGEPAVLPQARQLDIVSRRGEAYRLLIAIPPEPAPAQGFPMICMVDGNALFAPALSAARLQAARPEVTGVGPAVLVGIGYPGDAPFDAERRRRDLLPDAGGADRCLDLIEAEILPLITALAPIDDARLSLVGHSFGGLFALYALFRRPGLFHCHVASSPSIWWDDRAILTEEAAYLKGTGDRVRSRLFVTVGSEEQRLDGHRDPQRAERQRRARMLDNARELAGRLAASGRVDSELVVFSGENHVSVIPAMLSRAVAFALAESAGAIEE
jgi:uncharacterized protein